MDWGRNDCLIPCLSLADDLMVEKREKKLPHKSFSHRKTPFVFLLPRMLMLWWSDSVILSSLTSFLLLVFLYCCWPYTKRERERKRNRSSICVGEWSELVISWFSRLIFCVHSMESQGKSWMETSLSLFPLHHLVSLLIISNRNPVPKWTRWLLIIIFITVCECEGEGKTWERWGGGE